MPLWGKSEKNSKVDDNLPRVEDHFHDWWLFRVVGGRMGGFPFSYPLSDDLTVTGVAFYHNIRLHLNRQHTQTISLSNF